MRTIRRFDPWSVMRISAVVYALLGFLEGTIFSLVSTLLAPTRPEVPRAFGVFFGALAVVFLPIFFAVVGAVFAGLSALLYNVIAKYLGGIQVEVE